MNPNAPLGTSLDATHDPALRSWVTSANNGATDFPIQNLPYARARRSGQDADHAAQWRSTFLADGDRVVLRGRCVAAGAVGIGFGECSGRVTG